MRRTHRIGAAMAVLLAPSVYIARFGYRFGASDQDEFLPWLLARLHPDLLRSDWFVGLQETGFNVRTGFVTLLTPLARALSPEHAVAVLFVLSWILLAWAVYDVSRSLGVDPVPAVVATIVALAVLPRWTLGGNALGSSMLVPSLTGWALALFGMALFLRRRPWSAGVVIAMASWVQFLAGLHGGIAIALGGLLCAALDRSWLPRLGIFCLLSAALALPQVLLVLDSAVPAPVTAGDPDPFKLLAWFRAPHHYAPAAFPLADRIQAALVACAGIGSLFIGWKDRQRGATAFAAGILVAAGFAALLGWRAGGPDPVPAVALLQPFQFTMLVLVVASALASAAAWSALGAARPALERRAISTGGLAVTVLLAAVLLTVYPIRRPTPGTLDAIADWARENTASGALFALPPSATGFSYRSERSVLVTFKAVAFSEAELLAWHRRLRDMAPTAAAVPDSVPLQAGAGPGALLSRLDADWEDRTPGDLDRIARRYGATHFVRSTSLPGAEPGFSLLALTHGYRVYAWNGPRSYREAPYSARNGRDDVPGESPVAGTTPERTQAP